MSKTPYEIRTEVLQMAQSYMDQAWHMNLELTQKLYQLSKINSDELNEAYKIYSTDELIDKAKEMYKFVCDTK
jgi:predicted peroxiredoxin